MTLASYQRIRAIELEMALDALLDLDRQQVCVWVGIDANGGEKLQVFAPGGPLSGATLTRMAMLKPQLIEMLRDARVN